MTMRSSAMRSIRAMCSYGSSPSRAQESRGRIRRVARPSRFPDGFPLEGGRSVRMRIAVVVMLVGVLFAPQTPSRAATASDTLVYVNDISDMISLDPAVAYEFSGVLVAQNLYDTLVAFEGEDLTTLKPRLAQSWTIRDAGLTWKVTFKLRSGVKFSTGRPVTAKAVAFSFDRVIALNKSPAFLFKDVAGLNEGDTIPVGDDTVVVSLPKTASPQAFLSVLTFTVGGIVDPDEAMAHQSG